MTNAFGDELAKWRKQRRFSQLSLATEINVSQRHLSFLETGKARPSRGMLISLCDALSIPFRVRNHLLSLAGFAPTYRESKLDSNAMASVRAALDRMLDVHDPYPAFVVDRFWNMTQVNQTAQHWFSAVLAMPNVTFVPNDEKPINIAELTLHPEGLAQFIVNKKDIIDAFRQRLKNELIMMRHMESHGVSTLTSLLAMTEEYSCESVTLASDSTETLPVVPIELNIDGVELSLFSVISTLGTPQDITTDELRVESFYPNDEATERYFMQLANSA